MVSSPATIDQSGTENQQGIYFFRWPTLSQVPTKGALTDEPTLLLLPGGSAAGRDGGAARHSRHFCQHFDRRRLRGLATGVPVLDSDPLDSPGNVDIKDVQIANDDTYLYLHISYWTPKSFNTYYSFDTDNNTATGYNIYGLGLVGSEAAWVNDFDFDRRAGFNIGTLKDGSGNPEPASGAAIISSFVDSTDREVAIRRDTSFDPAVGPGAVFTGNSFTMLSCEDRQCRRVERDSLYVCGAGTVFLVLGLTRAWASLGTSTLDQSTHAEVNWTNRWLGLGAAPHVACPERSETTDVICGTCDALQRNAVIRRCSIKGN